MDYYHATDLYLSVVEFNQIKILLILIVVFLHFVQSLQLQLQFKSLTFTIYCFFYQTIYCFLVNRHLLYFDQEGFSFEFHAQPITFLLQSYRLTGSKMELM